MLPCEEQKSVLVHLLKADDAVAEEEYQLILFIADGLGMGEDNAKELLNYPKPVPNLKNLPHDKRFNYLSNNIHIMKADGKIYTDEIKFCEKIALNLVYKWSVIADLSTFKNKDLTIHSNREFLRSVATSVSYSAK
ncbi:MAG: TerB family tellurite resistance protein [Bacteroidota bacterium]